MDWEILTWVIAIFGGIYLVVEMITARVRYVIYKRFDYLEKRLFGTDDDEE